MMTPVRGTLTDVDLTIRFFLQLLAILVVCRIVGGLARRIGQAQVVGEMIAGVLLGPSLFGLLLPEAQSWLFPLKSAIEGPGGTIEVRHPSMSILYVVSQLGLVLYMFLVGLEFDLGEIKNRAGNAVSVSLAGVVVPLLLGGALAFALFDSAPFFRAGIAPWVGALFMGAAMAITAFPMLARIIYEAGISRTSLGTLALGAAAFGDAAAWILLALVLAVSRGDPSIVGVAVGGTAAFAALLVLASKFAFPKLEDWTRRSGMLTQPILLTVLALLLLGAWFTDLIGIYAVFGAFAVGAALPRGMLADQLREKCESLTVTLLLPIFFVYSGLNTRVDLMNSGQLWLWAGAIVLVAIAAKGVACALAARAGGETWRTSWQIGALMNARGLIELIILNIGLERGVITPTLFTIMVIMAISTTLMAAPLFEWLRRRDVGEPSLANAAAADA